MIFSLALLPHIPAILSVGFAGFGFLIAGLAYKTFRDTLRDSGGRPLTRKKTSMFYSFLAFSLILCGMALFGYSYGRPGGLNDPMVISTRINDLINHKTGIVRSLNDLGQLNEAQQQRLAHVQKQLEDIDKDLRRAAQGE